MHMKKIASILLILCLLTLATISYASAQSTEELMLGMSRDFGYAGFNNDIQGLFTLKIKDPPADLEKVVFFIDSTSMGEDVDAPFTLQFNTDSYPLGLHSLTAVGYKIDGTELNSNIIQVEFVPAGTGMGSVVKIIVPIVVFMVVMALVAVFLPIILSKGKLASTPPGTPRKYGIGGGAICPKCNRPFTLRLWWINLGAGKIDRCPYCGKWSYVRPKSMVELRAAEAAELADAQQENHIEGESEADKLKKQLDDSRFQDT
jgi:Zn ribbon nucleic-acid-binding protein